MKINAIDLKPGNVLEHQNKLWLVLKRELVQPGKGGAFAQVELRICAAAPSSTSAFAQEPSSVCVSTRRDQFLFMEDGRATFRTTTPTSRSRSPARRSATPPISARRDGMQCHAA
jgi:elongation factor P